MPLILTDCEFRNNDVAVSVSRGADLVSSRSVFSNNGIAVQELDIPQHQKQQDGNLLKKISSDLASGTVSNVLSGVFGKFTGVF